MTPIYINHDGQIIKLNIHEYFKKIYLNFLDKIQTKSYHNLFAKYLFNRSELAEVSHYPLLIKWIDTNRQYGLYAMNDIPSRTCIGHLTGQIHIKNVLNLEYDAYSFSLYQFGLWAFILDTTYQTNHFRFLNHTKEPNIGIFPVINTYNELVVEVHTLQPIKLNDELRINYGNHYLFSNYVSKINPCKISKR